MDNDKLKALAEESLRINGSISYEMGCSLVDAIVDTFEANNYLQDAYISCEDKFDDILSILRKIDVRGKNRIALDNAIEEIENVASEMRQACEHTNDCITKAINCL